MTDKARAAAVAAAAINHNVDAGRFEATIDGLTSHASYQHARGGEIVFDHTFVQPDHRGRGLAGRLVRAGLDHARAQGLAVVPQCPYVARWIQRHPEYRDLVAQR
ncbi:MAG: GNAT family N-acetyltransferase [Pseudomonadota bacterium]